MTKSDSIATLAGALAKAQSIMQGAAKDATNPHFKSKYADLASVWDACRKPLSDNGLSVAQFPSAEGPRVTVTTMLMHSSGEWLADDLSALARDDGPQGIGSVITYLRRYGLSAVAGVAPEDDDAEKGEARHQGYAVTPQPATNGKDSHAAPAAEPASATTVLKAVKAGKSGAKGELVTADGESLLCYDQRAVALAEQCCQDGALVTLTIAKSTSGNRYVKSVKRAAAVAPQVLTTELDEWSIPF